MSTYTLYPDSVKQKAIQLRKQGYSLYELSGRLNIRLATVQGWVKSVPLSARAKKRIHSRILAGGKKARIRAAIVSRNRTLKWKQEILEESKLEVQKIPLTPQVGRLLLATLYICEGTKYRAGGYLGFGNADPRMIRFFLKLLRLYFIKDETKFRCRVMYRWDQSRFLK